jgi:hypothetical protein
MKRCGAARNPGNKEYLPDKPREGRPIIQTYSHRSIARALCQKFLKPLLPLTLTCHVLVDVSGFSQTNIKHLARIHAIQIGENLVPLSAVRHFPALPITNLLLQSNVIFLRLSYLPDDSIFNYL